MPYPCVAWASHCLAAVPIPPAPHGDRSERALPREAGPHPPFPAGGVRHTCTLVPVPSTRPLDSSRCMPPSIAWFGEKPLVVWGEACSWFGEKPARGLGRSLLVVWGEAPRGLGRSPSWFG